jgi:hypothetical protein
VVRPALKRRKLAFNNDGTVTTNDDEIVPENNHEIVGRASQTELLSDDIINLQDRVIELSADFQLKNFDRDSFEGDKMAKKLLYYTGLPNLSLFLLILDQINPFLNTVRVRKLTNFQKLLLVFVKLRLNLDFTDLSFRFGIRIGSTVSSVFEKVIIALEHTFGELICMPDRHCLKTTMPSIYFNQNLVIKLH